MSRYSTQSRGTHTRNIIWALSYTLATVITQYGLQCNRQWLMKVSEQMKAILPQWSTQQMVIETSLR